MKAIHAYYERQVMEPAVRGFLSLLEKQFPSNSLYLFELLQNAVDDGGGEDWGLGSGQRSTTCLCLHDIQPTFAKCVFRKLTFIGPSTCTRWLYSSSGISTNASHQ